MQGSRLGPFAITVLLLRPFRSGRVGARPIHLYVLCQRRGVVGVSWPGRVSPVQPRHHYRDYLLWGRSGVALLRVRRRIGGI